MVYFLLKEPFVASMIPMFGPRAGGTIVSLIGGYFKGQKSANVTTGGLPCNVTSM